MCGHAGMLPIISLQVQRDYLLTHGTAATDCCEIRTAQRLQNCPRDQQAAISAVFLRMGVWAVAAVSGVGQEQDKLAEPAGFVASQVEVAELVANQGAADQLAGPVGQQPSRIARQLART